MERAGSIEERQPTGWTPLWAFLIILLEFTTIYQLTVRWAE